MNMLLTRGTSNQNYVSLVFSLTRGGQEPDGAELKSFVKGNKLVANCTVRRSRVEFILKARFGSMKDIDKLEQVTRETVSFLRSRGYQSCCQLNGDGTGGTGRQAVAQTVAVILFQKHRLAIDHADGPLVAG